MKPRQLVQNFAYTGELVNTTLCEWIDETRQGDPRNATPEDLIAIKDKPAAGYIAVITSLKASHEEEIKRIEFEFAELLKGVRESHVATVAGLRSEVARLSSPDEPAE